MKISNVYFRKNLLIVLVIIIFIVLGFGVFFSKNDLSKNNDSPKKVSTANDIRDTAFNQKWQKEISQLGGKQAYENFKIENSRVQVNAQHDMAHLFGKLLYHNYGLEGIAMCDDTFTYACYHSLVGAAIEKEGIQSLYRSGELCSKLTGESAISGCYHGTGHGALAHFGYDLRAVNLALDSCSNFPTQITAEWCSTGVFMEFNYQLMIGPGRSMRVYDDSDPIFPCDSIDNQFQPRCFFQQTQWWLEVFPGDDLEKVAKIVQICSERSKEEEVQCYSGLAIHLGFHLRWDPTKVEPLCNLLPTIAQQTACKLESADEFAHNPKLPTEAKYICDSLSGQIHDQCLLRISE